MKTLLIISLFVSLHFTNHELPDVVIKRVIKASCKFEKSTSGKFRMVKMLEIELKGPGQYTHIGDPLDYFIFDASNNFVSQISKPISEGIQLIPFNNMTPNTTYKIVVDLSINNTHYSQFSTSSFTTFQIGEDPCTLHEKAVPVEYNLKKTNTKKKGSIH